MISWIINFFSDPALDPVSCYDKPNPDVTSDKYIHNCDYYGNNQGDCGYYDCTYSGLRGRREDEVDNSYDCTEQDFAPMIFLSTLQCCACGGGDDDAGITL